MAFFYVRLVRDYLNKSDSNITTRDGEVVPPTRHELAHILQCDVSVLSDPTKDKKDSFRYMFAGHDAEINIRSHFCVDAEELKSVTSASNSLISIEAGNQKKKRYECAQRLAKGPDGIAQALFMSSKVKAPYSINTESGEIIFDSCIFPHPLPWCIRLVKEGEGIPYSQQMTVAEKCHGKFRFSTIIIVIEYQIEI
jgi:hypothetical protein